MTSHDIEASGDGWAGRSTGKYELVDPTHTTVGGESTSLIRYLWSVLLHLHTEIRTGITGGGHARCRGSLAAKKPQGTSNGGLEQPRLAPT